MGWGGGGAGVIKLIKGEQTERHGVEIERGRSQSCCYCQHIHLFVISKLNQVKKESKSDDINNEEAHTSMCHKINLVSDGVITTSKESNCIEKEHQ